jgi:hypothetical protein
MATATEVREDVAAAVREVIPEKWTVYPWMPNVEVLPCVIVGAGVPYRTHRTAGLDDLHLRLVVLYQITTGGLSADVIEAVIDLLLPKLNEAGYGWDQVAVIDEITTRSGAECFRGGIDLPPIPVTAHGIT